MDKEYFNKETAKALEGLSKSASEATEVMGLILGDMLRKMFRVIGLFIA